MELTYRTEGDYLIPNLTLPAEETKIIGKYGRLRRRYLQQHHRILYTNLKTTCKLNQHLAEIEQTANERMESLVAQMAMGKPSLARVVVSASIYGCAQLGISSTLLNLVTCVIPSPVSISASSIVPRNCNVRISSIGKCRPGQAVALPDMSRWPLIGRLP